MIKKVLVLSHDVIGQSMAGPGIRYSNIARELSNKFDVTVAVQSNQPEAIKHFKDNDKIKVEIYSEKSYKKLFINTDYIFSQWMSLDMISYAKSLGVYLIFDLYAPVPIEYLISKMHSGKKLDSIDYDQYNSVVVNYQQYALNGDYFVCSNELQRLYWIGFFNASGKFSTENPPEENIRDIIGLSPVAINDSPIKKLDNPYKKIKGINKDDFILVWTGGIWDWFDPKTVVEALEKTKDEKIKLVFLGLQHPNENVEEMKESLELRKLVKEKGLLDKKVFLIDGWLPHENFLNYLCHADSAVYAHKNSIETVLSHRTRVIDHLKAGVPTLLTDGDYFAYETERHKIGLVSGIGDADELANNILDLKNNGSLRSEIIKNIETYKKELTWKKSILPISNFIENSDSSNLSNRAIKLPRKPHLVKRAVRKAIKISGIYD